MFANVTAIPVIGLVAFAGPPLEVANISLAISLAWPASIVGIVSLSMTIAGTLPYGIVRLVRERDLFGISGVSLLMAGLNLLALIYWCRPLHRKSYRVRL